MLGGTDRSRGAESIFLLRPSFLKYGLQKQENGV